MTMVTIPGGRRAVPGGPNSSQAPSFPSITIITNRYRQSVSALLD
jgi:hypothetical protein